METSSKLGNSGLSPNSRQFTPSQALGKKDVKDVWCYNLDNEMNEIMRAATRYSYIGVVRSVNYSVTYRMLLFLVSVSV